MSCSLYGDVAGEEVFLTGWRFSRERTSHLRVPLALGDYRLEVKTSSGGKDSLPLTVSRTPQRAFLIDLTELELGR